TTVDPVVMAASTVMRLQTVVSREIGMTDNAVVSVGSVQAGSSANIIPDDATLLLNIRTFDDQVRKEVLASIKRIVEGEAAASGAPKPPEIAMLEGDFPLTVNDEDATRKVAEALRQRLGVERVQAANPTSASEDFTVLSRAWNVPSVYWIVGGVDPQKYAEAQRTGRLNDIPSNHSPEFAPVLD